MKGSIRERKPGVYELRVYKGRDPVTDKKMWISRSVRGSKRKAELELHRLITEVNRQRVAQTEATVAHLLDEFLGECARLGRSPNTIAGYEAKIRANIKPALGHVPIRALTARHLDQFYGALAVRTEPKPAKPATIRQHHAILHAAFDLAVRWEWAERNVVSSARPPAVHPKEVVPPTVEEVKALLNLASERDGVLAMLLWCSATTGARRGEMCALTWGNVDLEAEWLRIARSVVDLPGNLSLKGTKSHAVRRVFLDELTVDLLRAHRARQEEAAAAAGVAVGPDAFVFSQAPDGSKPYRPDRVSAFFIRLRRDLDLPHVTLHHLRHFVASQALAAGIDLRAVAGRLGHSGGGSITLKVYAHPIEAADRRAAAHMGALLAPTRVVSSSDETG